MMCTYLFFFIILEQSLWKQPYATNDPDSPQQQQQQQQQQQKDKGKKRKKEKKRAMIHRIYNRLYFFILGELCFRPQDNLRH